VIDLPWLDFETPVFPPTKNALEEPSGLLAAGGNLHPETLAKAYYSGIFPWYSDGEPPLWWSPNPRAILEPGDLVTNRTTRKSKKNSNFQFTSDQCFWQVINACAQARQGETWITQEMLEAYERLHLAGHAHSLEVWENDSLIGGLYGVQVGAIFCGESMFHLSPNASKLAFVCLTNNLFSQGFGMIDCQLQNPFLESLGVKDVSRNLFERRLQELRDKPLSWPAEWSL
jgi:leucyl/phenylalanyl-tRNA---protein transferase